MIQNICHAFVKVFYTVLFGFINFFEQRYGQKRWTYRIRRTTYTKTKEKIDFLESHPLNHLGVRADALVLQQTEFSSFTNEINQYVKSQIQRLLKNTYKKQIYLEKELILAKDIRFLTHFLEHNQSKTNEFQKELYLKERQVHLDTIKFTRELKDKLKDKK